jgi:hypothetical protein
MGLKRSLNREMKKLGYTPIKNRAFRNPRVLVMAWGDGETEIGLHNNEAARKRSALLPLANRTVFLQEKGAEASLYAGELQKYAVVGMKGQDNGQH